MSGHPHRLRLYARRSARPIAGRRAWLLATSIALTVPRICAADAAAADSATIRLAAEGDRIEVVGLSRETLAALRDARLDVDQWQEILSLTVASNGAAPIFGEHRVDGSTLAFWPRFPLRPGLDYRAVFNARALPHSAQTDDADPIEAILALPASPPKPSTRVSAVYPSGDELPENLLKFYLHFTAPMSRGDSYRHVHVVDASGNIVPDAFLEIGEELWDSDSQRLTLLFDPGRIKRGLKPREESGTPLLAGHAYALVIDAAWRDARGAALAKDYRKEFRVVAADMVQPDPKRWRLTAPRAGSRWPLVVAFDEPLDHAMLRRVVNVRDRSGDLISGVIAVDADETRWRFRPAAPWQAGRHALVVETTLEDVAGNSIGRPFEVDQFDRVETTATPEHIELPFDLEAPRASSP